MATQESLSQSEAAFQPNDTTFRLLFHHHPLPMWIYHLETLAFLEVNDAAVQKYGYSRAEFLQMTLKDIRPPEDVPRLLADVSQPRPPWQQSGGWRHRLKDGSLISVEITSHTLNYLGQPAALVTAQDITQRVQAAETLAAERHRLRALIDNLPDLIFLKDTDSRFLVANQATATFMSVALPEALLGKSDADFYPPEIAAQFRAGEQQVMQSGQPIVFNASPQPDASGREYWTTTHKAPLRNEQGQIVGLVGIVRDITATHQAQEAAREREAKLNALFEILPVGVSILGPDRNIVYANPAMTEILGMPLIDLSRGDHRRRRYLHPDGSPMLEAELPRNRVFAENQPIENVEIGIVKEDGVVTWVNVSAVPVPFADWKVLLTTTDITARKQSEQALNRRLALEKLLSFISASFVNIPTHQAQFDNMLRQVMTQLGAFFKADRVSLLGYVAKDHTMQVIQQWQAEGVPPGMLPTEKMPVIPASELEIAMQSGQIQVIPIVANLSADQQAQAQPFNLKSVLLIPLSHHNKVTGLLTFTTIQQEHTWPEAEFNILNTIGQIIAAALERRQITTDLQQSESRFHQIADNLSEVFYLADAKKQQTLYINPAYERVWGRRRVELYANMHDFIEAIYPDDRPLMLEALARQMTGQPTDLEYRVVRPDGEVRWVRDRSWPVLASTGQEQRIAGLIADITAYKTVLTSLERTNRRLEGLRAIDRAILRADTLPESPDVLALRHLSALVPCPEAILYTFDFEQNQATVAAHLVNGHLKTAPSPALSLDNLELAGLVAGQPQQVELTAHNLARPVDCRRFERGIRAVLKLPLLSRGKLLGKLTLLAHQPDAFTAEDVEVAAEAAGQIAIVLYQANLNAQIQRHTASLEGLVEQRTAEIAQINRRLQLATRAGNIGIWDWEIEPDRLVWNEQMYRLYGLSGNAADTINLAFWQQRLHPEDVIPAQALLAAALRNEQPYNLEFRIIWPDGAIRHIKTIAQVLFTDADQSERMLGINIDVTERKQAEQTLRRSRDQLSAANAELARLARLKDEFLANMSHELRTPLNAILGLAEILLDDVYGPLNEPQLKAMRVLEESGRHLLALINDILDVSKMEAGKLTLETAPVNVEALCQSSLRMIKELAHKKQHKISVSYDDSVITIPGDERRLKQLLVNLLSNAVKFTPPGGTIGLEVEGEPEQEVAHFTVWDTGLGIETRDIERLFQPFIQVDSSLSREQSGTGLGLVLVQRIARLHSGSVSLTSQVGQGSRFTVSLPWPVQTFRPVTTEPEPESAAPTPPLQRALLVEDNRPDATLLAGYLAEWDIDTTLLRQGVAVVEQAALKQPDVILLDLHLPDLSGWAVLAQLKAEASTQNIPVVITSVLEEAAQGLALGAAAYLVKPVTREAVQAALNQAAGHVAQWPAAQPKPSPLILLAEDNENNIVTLRDFLETQGFRLVVARNGSEAVMLAAAEQPDLILMDIQMPQLDGLEAIRRIRARAELAGVPIIALTALAMPGDRERCLAAGANDYLPKPVSLKGLLQAITDQLSQHA